ncbi:aminoacyl-tRNA hydrolase [Temperatibacter marinus]|uniref:Peptidyl-tRNA hydrolase n=1 Tax=Temperatibacter marinus TaxID=1456591 RepID=A0AA52EG73_9PROT|nr:aminoacyl-tRNA hydrolase [Temperatibacter marinus]WND03088.1 aminoacyl-tRNA hydrolase [Temperatibacter marinus]
MLLIVGLGNPGSKYERNRHNIGFMAVDAIVRRHNFSEAQKKFQSILHEGRLGGDKVLIIKPQTYMNESGRAVGEAMRFYKLTSADVVVFYDELDLSFAKVKVKVGGGHAGHNGIRSLINHIGADFKRVRMGIDHPGSKAKVHSHVLGDFNSEQLSTVERLNDAIADGIAPLCMGDDAKFLSDLAMKLNPPRKNSKPDPEKMKASQAQKLSGLRERDKKLSAEGPMAAALKALKKD